MGSSLLSPAQQTGDKSIKWTIAGELPPGNGCSRSLGVAGPVAGLYGGILLVAGGANFPESMPWEGGKKKYYDEGFVYAGSGQHPLLQKETFKLPAPVAYAASCSTPQGVLYAGGENENGISNKVYLLQWDIATEKAVVKSLPDLPEAITNGAASADGNNVYFAGGETVNGVSDNFYSLDLRHTTAGWTKLPTLPKPVSHMVLIVQPGGDHPGVYLMGGRKKNADGISELYTSVYMFDLLTQSWKEKRSMPYSLCAGTGIGTAQGSIFLFGGDKGTTFHQSETLNAATGREKDPVKKQALIEQRIRLQSTHPGFSNEILVYNTATDVWSVAGSIPFETPVTTVAVAWGNDVIIPSGEIRAGVRTPQLLLGKLPGK
ncbi:N-acetylneuraminate epimerase [Chitinophaga sp. MM2321]